MDDFGLLSAEWSSMEWGEPRVRIRVLQRIPRLGSFQRVLPFAGFLLWEWSRARHLYCARRDPLDGPAGIPRELIGRGTSTNLPLVFGIWTRLVSVLQMPRGLRWQAKAATPLFLSENFSGSWSA
jgi:hypothetical protein